MTGGFEAGVAVEGVAPSTVKINTRARPSGGKPDE